MRFFIALILLITCKLNAVSQQTASGKSNVYAVVIGVSNYQDPDVPRLQFANRDAAIFAGFLQSKAGGSVPKENIRLLTDSNATVAAVHMALRWLIRSCRKDDLVFIYFSGHGDLENTTMYNNAFLICYNTPIESYVGMSLSVTFLNDIANTLSVKTEAKVVLITDACHSGKMTGNTGNVNALVGQQLMNAKEKEIRIASSLADQLSNEHIEWGGGRGIFSYYLIKGLKGLADQSNDGIVTLGEIKTYLLNSMAADPVLKQENKVQTPVFKGIDQFALSAVDAGETALIKAQAAADSVVLLKVMRAPMEAPNRINSMMADDYFISLLKGQGLERLTDSLQLDRYPAAEVPLLLLMKIRDTLQDNAGITKLDELLSEMQGSQEVMNRVKEMLVIAFDDKVQEVINQYLKGDEAELERRRYYNIQSNGYDVYPRMLSLALRLTDPSSYYYNMLKVKLHYFTGVALRLKIPVSNTPALLIRQALDEQKKALALEKHAAYIYNELGVLYSYKRNDALAEKYFLEASRRSVNWAIPISNLADLYTGKGQLDKAVKYADSARKLQPDFRDILLTYGLVYEKKKNYLRSMESFGQSIKMNRRHFLPFERLGFVYMNTARFAEADTMFFKASERKKGLTYLGSQDPRYMKFPKTSIPYEIQCNIDPSTIGDSDMQGHFILGYTAYRDEQLSVAEKAFKKVIALDPGNPLAFHYLGRILCDQKRWTEAELILRQALGNYLPYDSFLRYIDSLNSTSANTSLNNCLDSCFRFGYYDHQEDLFMLASIYEKWGHYAESEACYRKIMESPPYKTDASLALAALLEKNGRYVEAESVLLQLGLRSSINDFYDRTSTLFPANADWSLRAGIFNYQVAKEDPLQYDYDRKEISGMDGTIGYPYQRELISRRPGNIPQVRLPIYGQSNQPTRIIKLIRPFTDGIRYFKQALVQMSGSYDKTSVADIYARIADLYNWQGLPDSAIWHYERSLELNPADGGMRSKLIQTYISTQRYSDALSNLTILKEGAALNNEMQMTLAELLIWEGRYTQADTLLQQLDTMNLLSNPSLTELKCYLNLFMHDDQKALAGYKKMAETDQADSISRYIVARIYERLGNRSEAWKWLESALACGFKYSFVLQNDPLFARYRKEDKWDKMLTQYNIKNNYPPEPD